MRVDSGSISDVGRKRKSNEDNYCANDEVGLYVVADGMGGHAAGEVASELVIATIEEFIKLTSSDADITWPFGIDEKLSVCGNRLKTAIRYANRKLLEKVQESAEYEGMATTVAAVLLEKNKAHIAHVGDSRVYLIRDGGIQLLTNDHSWVNEQVMSGLIDSEQARTHPLRNVVTRALGGKEGPEIDMQVLELRDGDLLLLCSDGLTSMVEDVKILEVVAAGGNKVQSVVRELVDAANRAGGEDNITTIALSFRDHQSGAAS
ncbi:MAG TPA: Stp1/IreP family PP2C-type Ser/Thr phosphatase [Vicinamibacteria bacterium]|nr:Stp1/IreP family PP2C-type Ser/Thr phosphatase [Vicinamibacteria bacterium]